MSLDKNQQYYYLQTMGITPWVLREAPKAPHVILMRDIVFNQDERVLLDEILRSIGLVRAQVHIERYSKAAEKQYPKALKLPHPADLIQNSLQKRDVYTALGHFLKCVNQLA